MNHEAFKVSKNILSIDPGRSKCGIALVNSKLEYINGAVVKNEELIDQIKEYLLDHEIKNIVIGSGTNSEKIIRLIREEFPGYNVFIVEEKDTTRMARKFFFKYNPPSGWLRIFPISMLVPSRPYDDFAAYVIARRFFLERDNKNI